MILHHDKISTNSVRVEGHSINKLQNGIILLIFKILKKKWNIGFVHNLMGHILTFVWKWRHYCDVTCTQRTQSVSAVICTFFYHLPNVTVKHHCELQLAYTRKMNTFSNETSFRGTYQCFTFSTYCTNLSKHWHTPVRLDCCDRWISHRNNTSPRSFSSTAFSQPQWNFLNPNRYCCCCKTLVTTYWMDTSQRVWHLGKVLLPTENE